jgi:hypothetical protein
MELSLDLIYKYKLIKTGVTGIYPSTDNCYSVDVVDLESGKVVWVSSYTPKPSFHMWEQLVNIKGSIPKSNMLSIINEFNEYGSWKYNESADDYSMNCEEI